MEAKNSHIVRQNPFDGLSKSAVNVYFVLLSTFKELESKNKLLDNKSFILSNKEIGKKIKRNVVTTSVAVQKLLERKLVKLDYNLTRYGVIRRFIVKTIKEL